MFSFPYIYKYKISDLKPYFLQRRSLERLYDVHLNMLKYNAHCCRKFSKFSGNMPICINIILIKINRTNRREDILLPGQGLQLFEKMRARKQ